MPHLFSFSLTPMRALAVTAALASIAWLPPGAFASDATVSLKGDQEVPAVASPAEGAGKFSLAADGSLTGKIETTTLDGTVAHIHKGAVGKNGDVLITLVKNGAVWSVPANTKLTNSQRRAFEAGDLYVNVHTAAHKDGEIRAQIKP